MSAVLNQVDLSGLVARPKQITEDVVIGKDILDLLAGSMYVDPLNVYREYVQNAADSIDEARSQQLEFVESGARVEIYIDHVDRSIRIRDNGVSIDGANFVQKLVTIGASHKRGKKLRGFRGVGRLAGLGYCQELIFRGRTERDTKVTELRWDGRALRERLRDQSYTGELTDIVREVTTVSRLPAEDCPSRFFEVELRKVSRLRNDILLNEASVRSYLAQVAPVPFDESFPFGLEIQQELESKGIAPPIQIVMNDGNGPIVHRITDLIQYSDFMADRVQGVEFIELKGTDGEVSAFGWVADHAYLGSIPKRLGLGGIRLRAGNIQVGDEAITASLFPESRFSGWAIGDIHIVSPKILPNGRRDEFEPSVHYAHLQSELMIRAKAITQKIRERSARRNRIRSANTALGTVKGWMELAGKSSLPSAIQHTLNQLVLERLNEVQKEVGRLGGQDADTVSLAEQFQAIESSIAKTFGNLDLLDLKSGGHVKPIMAALKVIITNSKTPDSGIALSLAVLHEIERGMA